MHAHLRVALSDIAHSPYPPDEYPDAESRMNKIYSQLTNTIITAAALSLRNGCHETHSSAMAAAMESATKIIGYKRRSKAWDGLREAIVLLRANLDDKSDIPADPPVGE